MCMLHIHAKLVFLFRGAGQKLRILSQAIRDTNVIVDLNQLSFLREHRYMFALVSVGQRFKIQVFKNVVSRRYNMWVTISVTDKVLIHSDYVNVNCDS